MPLPDLSLHGKVALVTGGGSGLGKAIAIMLADAGAQVAVAGRTVSRLEESCRAIEKIGGLAMAVTADVSDSLQLDAMVNLVVKELHHVDVLVNSAGELFRGTIAPLPRQPQPPDVHPDAPPLMRDEDWARVVDVNLSGTFHCCRAVAPGMIQQGGGSIINISSPAAFKVGPYNAPYHASKAAVSTLTRALAIEWGSYNVRVNAIAPGWVPTAMTPQLLQNDAYLQRVLRMTPLGRLGTPQEMAVLALYLASQASSFMTGQTVSLDGGLSAY